jgi:hypothetical protein
LEDRDFARGLFSALIAAFPLSGLFRYQSRKTTSLRMTAARQIAITALAAAADWKEGKNLLGIACTAKQPPFPAACLSASYPGVVCVGVGRVKVFPVVFFLRSPRDGARDAADAADVSERNCCLGKCARPATATRAADKYINAC